ncbi:MAG TPA: NAD/NADP octopine/nopaline dehydrogenase family protein [Castellaniella sp.]|uniref:NAD/NADP octopine/nopaline dehydrogenase family protein n=1 Tax=Castellaniella sp. TaxID=1955812 RepID=UPI002EE4653C
MRMRVGILGAGAIGFGMAAFLAQGGHEPVLWSPSGRRTATLAQGAALVAQGEVQGDCVVDVAADCAQAVRDAQVVVLALPAYGHKAALEAAAPHLRADQTVIISSHLSLGALYLSRLMADRGAACPLIVAWGTTLLTASQPGPSEVQVSSVRDRVDATTLPYARLDEGLALCKALFGDRFAARDGLLAIALSNLNPQNHLGIALLNLTRMERAETWVQCQNVTPAVGRIIEALDAERLAIAAALGLRVKTVREHFSQSFHVPQADVSTMNQEMFLHGHRGQGPKTSESRYVLEDVPYGLVPMARLGRMAGCPAHLHEAGIALISAAYGRDFTSANELLPALGLSSQTSLAALSTLAHTGYGH